MKMPAARSHSKGGRLARIVRGLTDRGGNVAVVTALVLPVLAGLSGMAVVTMEMTTRRNSLQNRLDAAVLAGATRAQVEGQLASAQDTFAANASRFAMTASFQSTGDIVSGSGESTFPNPFGGLIGPESLVVRTTAAAQRGKVGLCILGLNNLDNGSFDINGNVTFEAPTCAVQANSGATRGMTQEGQGQARAAVFAVNGGASTNTFTAREGEQKVDDPYASVPFPDHTPCGNGKGQNKALSITSDTTLSPGTYCGGIDVTGQGVTLTLEPGIYVMADGPLIVRGNADVRGTEVLIAFTGDDSTLRIWGDSTATFTSPVSGTYANMQFMQDSESTRAGWVSVGGANGDASKLEYDGVAYFPTQNFWIYGNASVVANSPTLAIVADKIWFQGHANVTVTNDDRRGLGLTGPVLSHGVRLVR